MRLISCNKLYDQVQEINNHSEKKRIKVLFFFLADEKDFNAFEKELQNVEIKR